VPTQPVDIDHQPGKPGHTTFQAHRGDVVQLRLTGTAALQKRSVSHESVYGPTFCT
jgi:hypothetical protein